MTGWLSSFFGRRRYFAGSIALFTIASFFCGSSHTLAELVFWRILQGIGGGALLSTSQAVLFEVFPRSEYGTAMAIFGMGVMVGPTLGPTFGGWITDTLSWPWIFYINLPFGALAFMLTLTYLRDSRFAQRVQRVDWLGLFLLAAGIGALQTMLEHGERNDWFSSREIVALAALSGTALVSFVLHELRTDHPVIDLRILKNLSFAAGVTFAGALGACLYATVFVLPVYLQQLQGFSANQTGLVILPGALASAFTMAFVGRLQERVSPRLLVSLGACLFTLAMWQWSHFTTLSGGRDFFWPLIVRGVGLGLVFVPLTNLAISGLSMDRIPAGTGLFNLTRQLGGSIGIALSATLLPRFTTQARAVLADHVTRSSQVAWERLTATTQSMIARGTPPGLAETKALRVIDLAVTRQATMLAFTKIFLLFGFAFLIALPLLLFMKRRSGAAAGGSVAH
ncbi:MAG: DHA2 family efflux MFS transporter permease subunit [Candidatus Eisenbacteria bacterium]|uniref:DHA2 family efflux MFS transporter permease subunit n=1 Tax=Eiseniibacteriota bacterium TaxID=2212470 RepID=A0A538TWX5_UNCEI|nr:MAG: DHA2 family efflux MFS transporter permease subunit [Candidatus Eisenbacteria bacterium]